MNEVLITRARVVDLRFPTSRESIGSDAVNKDPDYSAAYCVLETNAGVEGHGLTFTLGRGTDLVVGALEFLATLAVGRTLASITDNFGAFARLLTDENQFRWLGPEKGVIQLAVAALLNSLWDLYARVEKKPLWQLLAEMEPDQILSAIDFRYIDDALPPAWARELLEESRKGYAARLSLLDRDGFPAYTTSAGWFGFSDEKIKRLCQEGLAEGWTHFKLKVGGDPADDLRRGRLVREAIGPDNYMMGRRQPEVGRRRSHPPHPRTRRAQPLVDGRAHQPRRHPRPRPHPPRVRSPHRHRRALPQPHHVQAALPGRLHRCLPDR